MSHLLNKSNLKILAAVLAVLLFLILIILLSRAGSYIVAEDDLAEKFLDSSYFQISFRQVQENI